MLKKIRRHSLVSTMVLLAVATSVRAQAVLPTPDPTHGATATPATTNVFEQMIANPLAQKFMIDVPFGFLNGKQITEKYMYNPAIGAYTLGPDPRVKDMNYGEFLRHQMYLPKADPSYSGFGPGSSGTILPTDINRNQISGPGAPKEEPHPRLPLFSIPDEQMCAAAIRDAWTFSSDVLAPEVAVFSVRLPNQKLTTETFVIGANKRKFPVVVSSSFGQICIKDGAKALVCRSYDCLRVFNLTGGKESVFVRFPEGKVIAIGPGSELVAARSKDRLTAMPADGIARRGTTPVFSADGVMVAVNEFSTASVLQSTGLSHSLATTDNTDQKKLCKSVLRTAATLAILRGPNGFKGGAGEVKSAHLGKNQQPAPVTPVATESKQKKGG